MDQAQVACDQAVSAGIEAIWNFAPIHLRVPATVNLHNENLAASLTSLRLHLNALEHNSI